MPSPEPTHLPNCDILDFELTNSMMREDDLFLKQELKILNALHSHRQNKFQPKSGKAHQITRELQNITPSIDRNFNWAFRDRRLQ